MNSIKLIVVGEKHVGKTSIIIQYIENKFSHEYVMSTNADKSLKEIELENGTKIRIEIWDTAGQGVYRAANKIFMKNTKIALLVYDITDQKSFDALNEFYEQINEVNGKENVFFAVVGNKSDLYEEQVVTKEKGEEYAKSINALFFEASATDHECIENLFKDVVTEYAKNITKNNDDKKKEIKNETNEKIDNKPVDNKLPDKEQIENALKKIGNPNRIDSFSLNNQKKKKKDGWC